MTKVIGNDETSPFGEVKLTVAPAVVVDVRNLYEIPIPVASGVDATGDPPMMATVNNEESFAVIDTVVPAATGLRRIVLASDATMLKEPDAAAPTL